MAPDEIVVDQGRHGLWFFVIDSGEAEVVRDGRRTSVLGPGQYFGEAAVLRQVPQPATVRALMLSRSPTSLSVRPILARRSTSTSRSVSPLG